MKHFFCVIFFFFSAFSIAQQTEYVDFKKGDVRIYINPVEKKVTGKVSYKFDVLKPIDSIFIDAIKMNFFDATLNGSKYPFENSEKQFVLYKAFEPSKNNVLTIVYEAFPKKAMYFVGWNDEASSDNYRNQVWTQGQGKYTSNWLPSFDDVNEKIEFDLNISFPNNNEVISNGRLVKKDVGVEATNWHFDMNKPMSSYLLALVIGNYNLKVETSKSGIPIELYYYQEDSLKVEPTYRYTKQMFDFLEEEIGVPYPWQNYKQVPVHDFLYAGMENTSCTIFSDAFMVDDIAFTDKNYVNVNAHELAHQWFGDLVTAKSGEHHWLQEGFATYYALLAEKEIFGDDYYTWKLYEYSQELLEQDIAGNSTSLLDSKSSSTTFYKKGAWVLHMLREKVGDKAFKKAVKKYLRKHQFKNVETKDFIKEVEKATGSNFNEFEDKWLISAELPIRSMKENLCSLSNSIGSFLQLDCKKTPEACKVILYQSDSDLLNQKIIEQLGENISKSTFKKEGVKSRQAIAKTLTEIPQELKQDYERLLNDKSYITIESALYNLWNNFPEDRVKYLNQTKDIQGFNTKNVRLLWLVLALSTPEYEPKQSIGYYNELVDYTSPKYNFELRQMAFQYLLIIKSCKSKCYNNLQQATKHHNWRLSKFAKEQLKLINNN